MAGGHVRLDFSPIMSMAYLCEFANSLTPIALSSSSGGIMDVLSSCDGISALFNGNLQVSLFSTATSIPPSSAKTCERVEIGGRSSVRETGCQKGILNSTCIVMERLPKRREPDSQRDLIRPSSPSTSSRHLPDAYRSKLEVAPLVRETSSVWNSPTYGQYFLFSHEIDSFSKPSMDQMRCNLDKARAPGGPLIAGPTLSKTDLIEVTAHEASPYLRKVIQHCTNELKLFPSLTELHAVRTSRSRDALVTWYDRLREFIEFKRLNGHHNVPQKSASFPKLGPWVNKQRSHRQKLSHEKLVALRAVGFDWGKKLGASAWLARYQDLIDFRMKYGDCKYHGIIDSFHSRLISVRRSSSNEMDS